MNNGGTTMRAWLGACGLVVAVACSGGDSTPTNAEPSDAGGTIDASTPNVSDGGTQDVGASDTGTSDADAGPPCGAGLATLCELGEACATSADCKSAACAGGVCVAPDLCKNGAKDQDESDIDCGGAVCEKCDNGKACQQGSDCKLAECNVGLCQAASCTDTQKNGSETDVDCGGASCAPCDPTKACLVAADCKSNVCTGNVCQAPGCGDGKQNGTETGIDCGGSCTNCPTALPWGVDPDLMTSMAFLWSPPNPQQTGLDTTKLERKRVAIVRGNIRDRDGHPVADAAIAALDHPEYGTSKSLPDGTFSMAVNGGMPLTFSVTKGGMLGAQRAVDVPWQDIVFVDDTVLVAFDPVVTNVDFTVPALHKASAQTDGDGTRQAALFFAKDTTATMTLPDDSTQSLPSIAVRATEYTVGQTGVDAMPAALPPSSKYTYATEFSVDQAVAAKAKRVTFSKPVYAYVDNFLQVPVGIRVPNGFYDRGKGAWVPEPDGRVIKITGVTGGLADIDLSGAGPAQPAELAAFGFTDDERKAIADGYAVGKELWRVPLQHFSDFNFSLVFPVDAVPPPPWLPDWDNIPDQCDTCPGSELEMQSQSLGESVGIVGTPFKLHYKSERATGRVASNTVRIPITGTEALPPSVLKVYLKVTVAGRLFEYANLPKTANHAFTFTWDGNDAWGRRMQGPQYVSYKVGYEYSSGQGGNAAGGVPEGRPLFAAATTAQVGGPGIYVERGRYTNILWREVKKEAQLGVFDAKIVGLGGWTLSSHHLLLPHAERIYFGDGTRRLSKPNQFDFLVRNLAGGAPSNSGMEDKPMGEGFNMSGAAHVVMPDGRLYWAGGPYVWREEDGYARRYAGTGTPGTTIADGTLAKNADLPNVGIIAPGHDGSLYLGFDNPNPYIAKITPSGILKHVAGTGVQGSTGDWGPATAANIRRVRQVIVTADGTVIFRTDLDVRKITPDGTISTLASNVTGSQLALDTSTGLLYVDDANGSKIMRIDPSARVTHFAGSNDPNGFEGDDGPATAASLGYLTGMSVANDGSLYVSTTRDHVRRIGPDGIIMGIAGYGSKSATYERPLPALSGRIGQVRNIRFAPDRRLYFIYGDTYRSTIARFETLLPGFTGATAYTIGTQDLGAHVFDLLGRHVKTLGPSGLTLMTFGYDGVGRLVSITDRHGNVTTIERDAAGHPSAVVAPGGQKTTLSVTADGYLASVANPAGETTTFTYASGGLLTSRTDPMGGKHQYGFDADGRLASDQAPTGFTQTLSRAAFAGGHSITLGNGGPVSAGFKLTRDVVAGEKREQTTTSGAIATSARPRDNTRSNVSIDGVKLSTTRENDQRFGADSSYVSKTTIENGSRTSTTTVSRTTNFSDPSDPFGIVNVYDTATVNGRTYRALYDRPGKTLTLSKPSNRTRTIVYDQLERPISVSEPGVAAVQYTYDATGLVTKTAHDTTSITFGYDAQRRLTSETRGSATTSFAYDAAGRVTGVTSPLGRTLGFTYDTNGRRASVKSPSGASHSLTHDALGRMTSYTPPGGASQSFAYDPSGRLTGMTLADGRALALAYDDQGRPTTTTFPEGTVAISYVDGTGRVASTSRTPTTGAAQSTSFTYDGTHIASLTLDGVAKGTFAYVRDVNDWVVSRSLDGASPTIFDYDADGFVRKAGPFTLDRGAPRSAIESIRIGSAYPAFRYFYNEPAAREMDRIFDIGGERYRHWFTYDARARLSSRTTSILGSGTVVHTFGYDDDGALTEVKEGASVVEAYTYDTNGNRLTRSSHGVQESSTYSSDDRLLTRGALAYAYDGAGHLSTRGNDTFFYSARGELLNATVGGVTVTYAYDEMGRRVARTTGAGTTQYLYAGDDVAPTYSRAPDGTLSEYFYDHVGRLFGVVRAGTLYWVVTDQVGTPRLVTDQSGTVLMKATYDTWGVLLSGAPDDFDLPHGFAGGLRDSVTGLVRFGFRDYEPAAGRWTARDPLLFEGGASNLYAYAGNHPTGIVDRDGRAVVAAVAVAVVVAAATVAVLAQGTTNLLADTSTVSPSAFPSVPPAIAAAVAKQISDANSVAGGQDRAHGAIAGSFTNMLGYQKCIEQANALRDRLSNAGLAPWNPRVVANQNQKDKGIVHAWVEVTDPTTGRDYTIDPFKGTAFEGAYPPDKWGGNDKDVQRVVNPGS